MNNSMKTFLKMVSLGLIMFGVAANLPTGWALLSVGAGIAGLVASGGGGGG